MIVDIICLTFIALFFLSGLRSGFLNQFVRITAILGAFFLLSPIDFWVRKSLAGRVEVDKFPGDLLCLVLAWLLGYLCILLAGMILLRIVRGSPRSPTGTDRFLGGVLGALKACVIVYFVIGVLLLFKGTIQKYTPNMALEFKDSKITTFVEQHNVLTDMDLLPKQVNQGFPMDSLSRFGST